jgi:hypothetical protein
MSPSSDIRPVDSGMQSFIMTTLTLLDFSRLQDIHNERLKYDSYAVYFYQSMRKTMHDVPVRLRLLVKAQCHTYIITTDSCSLIR